MTLASVVGDSIGLRMILRNVGSEDILSTSADSLVASGSGPALIGSGPALAMTDLASGGVDTLLWVLAAQQPGLLSFTGCAAGTGADSGLERRALRAGSTTHEIRMAATVVGVLAQAASPATITHGQVGVVPLSFTIDHSVGDSIVDLALSPPAVVTNNEPVTIAVQLDLAAIASVPPRCARYSCAQILRQTSCCQGSSPNSRALTCAWINRPALCSAPT